MHCWLSYLILARDKSLARLAIGCSGGTKPPISAGHVGKVCFVAFAGYWQSCNSGFRLARDHRAGRLCHAAWD